MDKKVWVRNKNTNVKYFIGEEWFKNNMNDFEVTEEPKAKEEVKESKKKVKVVKKAKVTKKVLNKDKG